MTEREWCKDFIGRLIGQAGGTQPTTVDSPDDVADDFSEWVDLLEMKFTAKDEEIVALKAELSELDGMEKSYAAREVMLKAAKERAEAAIVAMREAWCVMAQVMSPKSTHPGYRRDFYEIEKANLEQCGKVILDTPLSGSALLEELKALRKVADAVNEVILQSHGVSGWHMNGNIALWEEFHELAEALAAAKEPHA